MYKICTDIFDGIIRTMHVSPMLAAFFTHFLRHFPQTRPGGGTLYTGNLVYDIKVHHGYLPTAHSVTLRAKKKKKEKNIL